MNITRYSELKAAGIVQLVLENNQIFLVATMYDEWTGQPIGQSRKKIDRDDVLAARDRLQAQRDSLQELITDAQALLEN